MIHSKRRGVHKGHSARKFRKDTGKSHVKNVKLAPRRGGWRL